MKKITSFLMMMVLCCAGAFAQATEYANKLVTIGTAQAEVVPGQWYFLHNSRNPNNPAEAFAEVGGTITSAGGFVTDLGAGNGIKLSATSVIDEVMNPEGVNANRYMAHFVRFVAVEGEEGAYNIQFGTGNWIGHHDGGNSTNIGSVNHNNYLAGNVGKYNFYLVNINGAPNTAGRFGWNKYNMANRVDNNGAGNTVVFWETGETTSEASWTTDADIKGNKIWQIYDIVVVGDADMYAEAFNELQADYDAICAQGDGAFIDELKEGKNVGDKPGNYIPENVNAFLALHNHIEDVIVPTMEAGGLEAVQTLYPTVEDLEKFNEEYVAAWNHMIEKRVPRAMTGIQPGYYTFSSCQYYYTTKKDTTFYTQEEADAVNAEYGYVEGDEGYIAAGSVKEVTSTQVAAPIKSLYFKYDAGTDADWMAWGTQQPKAEFLWKIETVEGKPTEYRMINVANGKTHISIDKNTNSKMEINDTATVSFDWRNDEQEVIFANAEGVQDTAKVVSFNIRSSKQPEGAYNYLHCANHDEGAGTGSWISGWADGGAVRWYMTPIDEATANDWINGPAAQLRAKIEKGDSIVNAFPAQLKVAKDLVADLDTTIKVANAENFFSPFTCTSEGAVEQLFDGIGGELTNFWHSEWNSGSANAYSTTNGTNYFVINDTESLINGGLAIMLQRRDAANDHVLQFTVYGTNDAYDVAVATEALKADSEKKNDTYNWTELGILETPRANNKETVISNAIEFEGQYSFYKFVATSTVSSRGYFHMGEFQLYPATISKRYETTQYDARKAEADALAAAVDVWNKGEFAADNLELLEDETFAAAYNALVAAAEAWSKVYVNPAALREAIAAAPAENLFVIGNNPGQWKEGVVTPAATVAAAEAYNASGAYTPAESEAHLAAIAKAEADVWAAANKVETGKWYRIKFPTEEMYETYGWDKTGAQATISHDIVASPALFGKTVAAANNRTVYQTYINDEGNEAEVQTYYVEAIEEAVDGQALGFFEDESEDGMDLFRFIQATDSTYMLQNKATGLFVRAGYPAALSAIPSYYYTKAIGAGVSLIGSKNIFGGAEQGYAYLHGERATNVLTTWSSTNLASNSMLMIEEVENVTDEPTSEYMKKFWPGMTYAFTMPVETKIVDGATAYAAALQINEEDTVIVLSTFEDENIKAGTPYIVITECEDEYVTTTQATNAVKEAMKEELGVETLNKNQQIAANDQVNDMYTIVTMEHGMVVDTVANNVLSLQGTMKQVTVKAGKAIVTKENGFAHTLVNTNVPAFGAYIVSDFDPESADIVGKLKIKIEGSVGTGINEVLDKVAKSGNIYNAAGQLVGKGNINTVNNLPAGIYIVNGVKVTKK